MISDTAIERAAEAGKNFKPAIIACSYDPKSDRIELVTVLCVITIDRRSVEELRDLRPEVVKNIYASQFGIHVDEADIDINSAGLITDISKRLATEVAASL